MGNSLLQSIFSECKSMQHLFINISSILQSEYFMKAAVLLQQIAAHPHILHW